MNFVVLLGSKLSDGILLANLLSISGEDCPDKQLFKVQSDQFLINSPSKWYPLFSCARFICLLRECHILYIKAAHTPNGR